MNTRFSGKIDAQDQLIIWRACEALAQVILRNARADLESRVDLTRLDKIFTKNDSLNEFF